MTNKNSEKWLEQFAGGEVWELLEQNGTLYGEYKNDSIDGYDLEEVADNGISSPEERARIMGLNFQEVK